MSDQGVIHLRSRQRRPLERVLLLAGEVAERLRVDQSTVRRWTREGKIPHVRLGDGQGSPVRYPLAAVDEWWQRRQEGGRL